MSRVAGHRWATVAVLAVALSIVGVPAGSAQQALVFEVDGGPPQRTARIAWHLLGDNIVNPSVGAAWYSGYLEDPGDLDGTLTADTQLGTLRGTLTETWDAGGDLGDWTTLRLSLQATVTDARLLPDGDGWTVEGTVAITYRGQGTMPETPSVCGQEECYICADRVCTFDTTASTAVPLTGRLEASTITLAFRDGLVEDVEQVDVSGLADQEYFLSLFSVTIPGGRPMGAGEEGSAPIEPVIPAEAGAEEAETAPGSEIGAGEGTTEEEEEGEASAEPNEEPGAEEEQDSPTTPGPSSSAGSRWPLSVWLVLLLGVTGGLAGVWIAMKGVILLRGKRSINPLLDKPSRVARSIEKEWQKGVVDPEPTILEYEEDVREDQERRFLEALQGDPEGSGPAAPGTPPPAEPAPTAPAAASGPAPPPAEPPPPPPPPAFEPDHEIVLGEEIEHHRVPGSYKSGTTTVVELLDPGTPVQLVGDEGDYVMVRRRATGRPIRIHKSGLRPKN